MTQRAWYALSAKLCGPCDYWTRPLKPFPGKGDGEAPP